MIFNPLSKLLYGKLTFFAWRRYSETVFENITKCEMEEKQYFESDSSSNEEEDYGVENSNKHSPTFFDVHQNRHFVSRSMSPNENDIGS